MFSLIKNNVKRNFSSYLFFYLALMLIAVVIYLFFSIPMNNSIQNFFSGYYKIYIVFKYAAFVVAIFSIVFINYSVNYFVNKRNKELALYSLFGLRKKEIALMISLENIFVGILSVISGVILGIIWSKFMIMLLIKYLEISFLVEYSIEFKTILYTIIFYLVVMFLSSIIVFFKIYKLSLLELFQKSFLLKKRKKSYFLGILSFVILILGYYLGIKGVKDFNFFIKGIGFAIAFSIIGTVLFFRNFMTSFLDHIINNNSKILLKGDIVWLRRLTYRIESNYIMMSITSILVAVTLTSIGIIASLNIQTQVIDKNFYEYDLSYITNSIENNNLISNKIGSLNMPIKEQKKVAIKKLDSDNYLDRYIISDKFFNTLDVFTDETILYYENKLSLDEVDILDKPLKVQENLNKSLINSSLIDELYIIDDSLYKKIVKPEEIMVGYSFKEAYKYVQSLGEITYFLNENKFNYVSIANQLFVIIFFKMLIFIVSIIGLIFIFSSASILYIKVVSNTISDCEDFKILSMIGFSNKKIKKYIKNYAKSFYYIPLIFGVLHSAVAIYMLKLLMDLEGFFYKRNIFIAFGKILFIFLIIYFIFYKITIFKSYDKVFSDEKKNEVSIIDSLKKSYIK